MLQSIILENFRCFREYQEIPLAPLTFLVGENSTGKTSFLAAVRLACRLPWRSPGPDFNEEPFELGAFDQIVSLGSRGPERAFTIGASGPVRRQPRGDVALGKELRYAAAFGSRGRSAPTMTQWRVGSGAHELLGEIVDRGEGTEGRFRVSSKGETLAESQTGPLPEGMWLHQLFMGHSLAHSQAGTGRGRTRRAGPVANALEMATSLLLPLVSSVHAVAPVRSRPRRTYDPLSEMPTPSGEHAPTVLARMKASGGPEWEALKQLLKGFGDPGAMFGGIEVRRLGKSAGDPFQIRVKIGRRMVNLIDVGYGVSQVLPILLDSHRLPKGGTMLLQQPEVHLHPRAQAELGAFFGQLAGSGGKGFVVETHSDYMVDRVRWMVRERAEGFVEAKDVLILYFERDGADVRVHPIRLDDEGNLVDVPPGYRDFFLTEERRFLGV